MPIALSDIPQSVGDYLKQHVTTTASAITPTKPNQDVLTPGEDGSTTITVTNAAAPDGIRLIDLVYHVKISDDSVAFLIPALSVIVHSSHDLAGNDPIKADEKPTEMFVRSDINTTLDPGATSTPINISVHCKNQGEASLTCHVHADIDQSELFPTSRNKDGEQALSVV
jgi:hypothetical protein